MSPFPSQKQQEPIVYGGGLQYWTEKKAKNEIDMLKYIDQVRDSQGLLHTLIRDFSEKMIVVQARAQDEGKQSVMEEIAKAGPAMKSAAVILEHSGIQENPLTLAQKYEWKKTFRWLNDNLFIDTEIWAYYGVPEIRRVVQRGYLKTNELPAPRIAELFSLKVYPGGEGRTEIRFGSEIDSLGGGPSASLEVSYLDPILEHAKYMKDPTSFMSSTARPYGRYADDNAYKQTFRFALDGDIRAVLGGDDLDTLSLSKDYRIPETVRGTMSFALRRIAKSPEASSFAAPLTILSREFDELPHYHRDLLSVMPAERPAIIAKAKLEHEEALIAAAIAEERKAVFEADKARARNAEAAFSSWRSSASTCLSDSSSFDGKFAEKADSKVNTAQSEKHGISSLFRSCMGMRR